LSSLRYTSLIMLLLLLVACTSDQSTDEPLPTLAELPSPTPTLIMPSSATGRLAFWQTAQGTLTAPNQVDIWEFTGEADAAIRIGAVGEVPDISFSIELQDVNGITLAQAENNLRYTLATEGDYRILVHLLDADFAEYEIGLAYTDRPNPNIAQATPLPEVVGVPTPTPDFGRLGTFISSIAYGETYDNIFTENRPQHIYTFIGSEGDLINAQLERISGNVDPVLILYDGEGNPLAMDDNSGGGRTALLRNVRLLADGDYSLRVTGAGNFGDYVLRFDEGEVEVTPEPMILEEATPVPPFSTPPIRELRDDIRLADHVAIRGSLRRESEFRQYSFYAEAGEIVTLAAVPSDGSEVRPILEIYNPEGELVTTASTSASRFGGAWVAPFIAETEGAHLVFLTSENDTTGDYLLSYGSGTSWRDLYQQETQATDRIEGAISQVGNRDVWIMRLSGGDVISVAASPTVNSGLDPVIEVATQDGISLATDDNGGGSRSALIESVAIPTDGYYLIRLHDATGLQTGSYNIVWRYVNRAPTATPEPDFVTIMSMDDVVADNDYNFYVFQGQAGQRVRIRVEGKLGSGFDPVAALLAPDSTILAIGDDDLGTLNPNFTVTLPEDGTYTLRINGYLSGGAFDVYVDFLF